MKAEWLKSEMESIAVRLKAEGAEGVILAVYFDDAKNESVSISTKGELCPNDGLKLGSYIFQHLMDCAAPPTTEARQ